MKKVGTALAEPGADRPGWVLVGAILLFGVFDRVGNLLQSGRGQAGWFLCALVIGIALILEVAVFRRGPGQGLRELGFRATGIRAIFAAVAVAGLMLLFFPLAGKGSLRSDWLLLLPGLFAQHGLAEETLFRGFVFRHLRARRSFARAALLSTLFFVAAHLYLFTYMSAPIAFASTLLSVATAYPLAWLFEKGGNTVWAPALLHTTVHAIKVMDLPEQAMALTLGWMAVCAVAPWLVFLIPRGWFGVSPNATS